MEIKPKILFGQVTHKRFFPKINQFTYGIYYLALPLSQINKNLERPYFKFNRWGLLSFYNKDHGDKNESELRLWADRILKENNVLDADGEIILITMPRVFGYVFNPVSFWYCYNKKNQLRAVICEVNNTFDETHVYICGFGNNHNITKEDILETDKIFHVSPFLPREGNYKFRFSLTEEKMGAWIDYYDKNNNKQLVTLLTGQLFDFNKKSIKKAFWQYPLITIKAILLIHWQAVKLFLKKIEYVPKPIQMDRKISKTSTKERED